MRITPAFGCEAETGWSELGTVTTRYRSRPEYRSRRSDQGGDARGT